MAPYTVHTAMSHKKKKKHRQNRKDVLAILILLLFCPLMGSPRQNGIQNWAEKTCESKACTKIHNLNQYFHVGPQEGTPFPPLRTEMEKWIPLDFGSFSLSLSVFPSSLCCMARLHPACVTMATGATVTWWGLKTECNDNEEDDDDGKTQVHKRKKSTIRTISPHGLCLSHTAQGHMGMKSGSIFMFKDDIWCLLSHKIHKRNNAGLHHNSWRESRESQSSPCVSLVPQQVSVYNLLCFLILLPLLPECISLDSGRGPQCWSRIIIIKLSLLVFPAEQEWERHGPWHVQMRRTKSALLLRTWSHQPCGVRNVLWLGMGDKSGV